jgi:hypothetical protein
MEDVSHCTATFQEALVIAKRQKEATFCYVSDHIKLWFNCMNCISEDIINQLQKECPDVDISHL